MTDQTATQATDHQDRPDKEMEQLRRSIRSIMVANRSHVDRLTDAHQATIGELRRAEDRVRGLEERLRLTTDEKVADVAGPNIELLCEEINRLKAEVAAARELVRYRDWLADQVARADAADQVGGVPPELLISPHNGIAAGLRTALLGLDQLMDSMDQAQEDQG